MSVAFITPTFFATIRNRESQAEVCIWPSLILVESLFVSYEELSFK